MGKRKSFIMPDDMLAEIDIIKQKMAFGTDTAAIRWAVHSTAVSIEEAAHPRRNLINIDGVWYETTYESTSNSLAATTRRVDTPLRPPDDN